MSAENGAHAPLRQWPNRFHDRLTHAVPRLGDAWRERFWFIREHGPWKRWRRTEHALPAVRRQARLPAAPDAAVRATWVGHATSVLQMDGRTLLLDPVWSDSLWGGIRRITPPGVPWRGLPAVDGVLVSHNHYDHLDLPTLRRLAPGTPVFVPAGTDPWLRRKGIAHVVELDWWESARLDGLRVELVPAHHWSRRMPWDTNRHLWGGWVVSSARHKAYFAGDTAYGPCFAEIGRRHPGLDLAVMPIGAYAPRSYNGRAHVDPEEALQAFLDLGARTMMPVHWGTFRLSPEPVLEPIQRLAAAWRGSGLDPANLWSMAIGDSRALPQAA